MQAPRLSLEPCRANAQPGSKIAPLAGGTRIARVLLDMAAPPTSRADPMLKICVSMPELQRRALSEVRSQPGCHNVQEVAINRVAEPAENNWSLCVLAAGAADAIPPRARRLTSRLFCAGTTICWRIDLEVHKRKAGDQNGPPLHILDIHDGDQRKANACVAGQAARGRGAYVRTRRVTRKVEHNHISWHPVVRCQRHDEAQVGYRRRSRSLSASNAIDRAFK